MRCGNEERLLEHPVPVSLEEALSKTQADAVQTLEAVGQAARQLRKLSAAARTGNLRDLRRAFDAADQSLGDLRQQFANAKSGWRFDEEAHLTSGAYARELLDLAKRSGLSLVDRDERLYCYPSIIRVSAPDRAVYIDRRRERKLRPSVLLGRLKDAQRKPPRFRPDPFLAALHTAYTKAVAMQRRWLLDEGPVVPLVDIYELLTLLPGQSREYTRHEFARDIYLLHRSVVATTRNGARVSFPVSRGVKGKNLTVVNERGEEVLYYGLAFTPAAKGKGHESSYNRTRVATRPAGGIPGHLHSRRRVRGEVRRVFG